MAGTVRVERDGMIATVLLDNPGRLNAVTSDMWRALDAAFTEIYDELSHHALAKVSGSPHPVVALIKGACVGGGLEIAAQCDIRICGQSSRFGIPVKRLGLVVAYREMQGLLSVVSAPVALEILLEGRVFDAAEADKKGLVTRVVPDDQVEAEAYKSAPLIVEGARL